MKIYFAGSIRGGRQDSSLYLEIIDLLREYGQVLTEHVGNKDLTTFGEDGSDDETIYERDLKWLNESDAVVAEVTVPSLGVGYEIGKADGQKPILCLYRDQTDRNLSPMVGGNKNVTVKTYKSIKQIERILDKFFSSLIKE